MHTATLVRVKCVTPQGLAAPALKPRQALWVSVVNFLYSARFSHHMALYRVVIPPVALLFACASSHKRQPLCTKSL